MLKKFLTRKLTAVIFLLFSLSACSNASNNFSAEIVSKESAFYSRDGMEIDSLEYFDTWHDSFYLTIEGFVKRNRSIYGQIATFESFSKETILIGTYGGIQSELDVRLNGQTIRHWDWMGDLNMSPSIGDNPFAANLSLNNDLNEIVITVIGRNGSYIKQTLHVSPIDVDS